MCDELALYPLTHPQKRIWYIEKIYPGTPINNVGGTVKITGELNYNVLEKAIMAFIKSNDAVRIQLKELGNKVKQYVKDTTSCQIDYVDFSYDKNPEEAFRSWVELKSKTPFVMEDSPLYYFAIFKMNQKNSGYYIKFHHIICDGWSIKLMTNQINQAYGNIHYDNEFKPDANPSYLQYIDSEKEYLASAKMLKNKEFWLAQFLDLPEYIEKGRINNLIGRRKSFYYHKQDSDRILKYVKDNNVSLYTLFTAAIFIYLRLTECQDDLVVGIPVLNRKGKEKNIFGMFTSTLPLRIRLNQEDGIESIIHKIQSEMKRCLTHQQYPYDLLVQDLNLRGKGFENLFSFCVNYYNTKLENEMDGMSVENTEIYSGRQIYPLQIIIKEWYGEDNLAVEFDYQLQYYNEETICQLYSHINRIIDYIIIDSEIKVKDMNLLAAEQIDAQISDYHRNYHLDEDIKTIDRIFDEQVNKSPDKIVVYDGEKQLTYKELKEKSERLAGYLVHTGAAKENVICIITKHSIETVIGILGIIKAGCAFLPIDVDQPVKKIHYMLHECGVSTILTNCPLDNDAYAASTIVRLDEPSLYEKTPPLPDGLCENKPSDLVYIIYTSGSTGNPKGVMIEHHSLVNYILWAKKTYIKKESEIFPLYSSLSFDLTLTSVFLPLISEGRIVIYREEDDNDQEHVLYRIWKDKLATIVKLTPSHLALINDLDNSDSTIKTLIVGGEELKTTLAISTYESFKDKVDIFNEYGPTEATIGCIVHKFDVVIDTNASVPVGRAIDNMQVYILDQDLKLLPLGCIGEIYISGRGVARGYAASPEMTRERFISNPFIVGENMYKTGDLARFTQGGNIEVIGRVDRQVKIRGFRIELGEIENYLLHYDTVANAVVAVQQNQYGDKYLCAYIVEKTKTDILQIKHYLKQYLQDYAIPHYWFIVSQIPLTSNGKVDYRLLPKPNIDTNKKNTTPKNEKEAVLLDCIRELVNAEKIGMRDNFFFIGGDSIKAIQLSSKLMQRGYKLKVKEILSSPVLADMANFMLESDQTIKVKQKACFGSIMPTPITEWFFAKGVTVPDHYCQSVILSVQTRLGKDQLTDLFQALFQHHDTLRINYDRAHNKLFYNEAHLFQPFPVAYYDFTHYSPQKQQDLFQSVLRKKTGFNIEKDILMQVSLIDLGNSKWRILIEAHHLIIDGVSWRILIEDISMGIKQIDSGESIMFMAKTDSYGCWGKELDKLAEASVLQKEKSYWETVIGKKVFFPENRLKNRESCTKNISTIDYQLTESETENLLSHANYAFHTKADELLIISLVITIAQYSGQNDVALELENHGRRHDNIEVDVSRTVGWFTSIFPVHFYVNTAENLDAIIKAVKEQIRRTPNNGIGFGVLKYLRKEIHDSYENARVRFNYLGDMTYLEDCAYVTDVHLCEPRYTDSSHFASCPMEINIVLMKRRLSILIGYDDDYFNKDTIERFLRLYGSNIVKVMNYCINKAEMQYTPSDFDSIDITQDELNYLFDVSSTKPDRPF